MSTTFACKTKKVVQIATNNGSYFSEKYMMRPTKKTLKRAEKLGFHLLFCLKVET